MEVEKENTVAENTTDSTPTKDTPNKGKKRNLSVSDDDNMATLVGMGFDLDIVTEALASHPSGTSVDIIKKYIETNSAHTPKKQRIGGKYSIN